MSKAYLLARLDPETLDIDVIVGVFQSKVEADYLRNFLVEATSDPYSVALVNYHPAKRRKRSKR